MYSLPSKREKLIYNLYSFNFFNETLRNTLLSESIFRPLSKTKLELFGLDGLSNYDANKIYQDFKSTDSYWKNEISKRNNLNIIESKSDIYATKVITGRMIRKLQNFCDIYESSLVMPFTSPQIKDFFDKLPLNLIYDEKSNKNKIFLREILKIKLNLDSDKIGKMGWSYDFSGIIKANLSWVKSEIIECKLWNTKQIDKLINRFLLAANSDKKYSKFSTNMIYRIFLLSLWYNHNIYLNK
jgi:asparagine synthase (glutamine-hydrolysing)